MRYFPTKIEPKWQKRWLAAKTYEPDFKRAKKPAKGEARHGRPFYNLMMFPYPSAEGLHVGNMYAFIGADIYGRFKRMQGYDVFEPIGLDGFGIHSENYALRIGKHPAKQAKISEKNFYRQLAAIGNGFAWEERLETYDPDYYRWTQWIFIQLFKRGLAYRKKAAVNWCPSCMTVLADEQVIQKFQIPNSKSQTNSKSQIQNHKHEMQIGVCERCDTAVIKKDLEQWFFRITDYAERLAGNLDKIDWSEKIKIAQRNWIGKSEGALIKFKVQSSKLKISETDEAIEVFTTRPDTLFGATYLVLSPEHKAISNFQFPISNQLEVENYTRKAVAKTEEERIAEGREKTGVEVKGIKGINPATKEEIPVWVADYVLGHVGTGAIMAVPAHDQRDFEFAKKYQLPIKKVIQPPQIVPNVYEPPRSTGISASAFGHSENLFIESECWAGDGVVINSEQFNGVDSEKAKWEIVKFVSGAKKTQYRLRDWLISRQRYWGPPIPMIFCEVCQKAGRGEQKEMPGWYTVPEKNLPVKLPYIKNFRPTGTDQAPLASVKSFYRVRCPECKAWARRETDVSDTFLDSAWYYLRYPSVGDRKNPWSPAITKKWFPVDMYIGGAEHAVLHLLYVRFLAMAFYDQQMIHFEEPFKMFRAHGLIIKDGAKMSKSKGNIVNPDEYVRAYGADALRMYLMFLGPFEHGGDFRDSGIKGITRFLERVWRLGQGQIPKIRNPKFPGLAEAEPRAGEVRNKSQAPNPKIQNPVQVERLINATIKKVTGDIENLQYNTAISALMILLNGFEASAEGVEKEQFMIFLKLLAPFAPHITEELWHMLGERKSIHLGGWPEVSEKILADEKRMVIVEINGKVRDRVELGADAAEEIARGIILALPSVRKWVGDRQVKKFVYIKGRVANIVI